MPPITSCSHNYYHQLLDDTLYYTVPSSAANVPRRQRRRAATTPPTIRLPTDAGIYNVLLLLLLLLACCCTRSNAFLPPHTTKTSMRPASSASWKATRQYASTMADGGGGTAATSRVDDDDDDDDEGSATHQSSPFKDAAATSNASNSDVITDSYDYPWSEAQEWALRDNLPKYIVRIPSSSNNNNNNSNNKPQLTTVALWRSLLQDVPELAGYPVPFLQAKYKELQQQQQAEKNNNNNYNQKTTIIEGPIAVLPFLQDYEFSAQGGVCGTVYGLEGVADGSRIETSAVHQVQETLPQGYVQTTRTSNEDGSSSSGSGSSVAFEMGRPLAAVAMENDDFSSSSQWRILPGGAPAAITSAQQLAKDGMRVGSKALVEGATEVTADGYLVRLGAVTGIVLAGATAFNMISHHMTVNVFWV